MYCERRRGRSAFSLIEVMLVIVIIALLAGAVSINVRGYLVKAKQSRARQDIGVIVHALTIFWSTYNRYPSSDEGLAVLTKPSEKMPEPPLSGGGEPLDPWGQPYQYVCPGPNGQPFVVMCLGADNKPGGTGADQDISSEDLNKTGQ